MQTHVQKSGLVAAVAVALLGGAALALRQPPAPTATAAEPSATATPSPAEQTHAALHGRYAEARLRLARANLAKAEDLAGAIPGQVSEPELAGLRRRVALLERHVQATRDRPHDNGFQLSRAAAEAAAEQAAVELEAARAANQRAQGAVSPRAILQLEAALELAEIRRSIWDDPSFLDSPLQVMQMQIDQLTDEVFELILRTDSGLLDDRR
jgi:hypothetical protein